VKVAVIGTGYVGSVTAACLAMVGHQVFGFDTDPHRAGELSAGQVPFYEPGLSELVTDGCRSGRLLFSADASVVLSDADIVFLCVGTPPGPGGLPDMSQFESAAEILAPYLRNGTVVVNKSTVPVGSGNWVRTMLEDSLPAGGSPEFAVVSNPEFLREGAAIDDFLYPDRVVLGGREEAVEKVASLYQPILDQSFAGGRPECCPALIRTDLPSAEMIKYAANAFLASKISFANEIATVCELVGADARQVLPAIGADDRIGPRFLAPGLGWGGSCFGKDVAALIATAVDYGTATPILRAAVDVNVGQRALVIRKLQNGLKTLKGRRIAILGLSFKPETDDLRDSPALDIARRLLASGARVSAYDPIVKELPAELGPVRIATDPYDAADRADAVVLATEWQALVETDLKQLASVMTGNLLVDGRNCLSLTAASAAGLELVGVGW
jgi:UDPglucose 6-dehydrogenase